MRVLFLSMLFSTVVRLLHAQDAASGPLSGFGPKADEFVSKIRMIQDSVRLVQILDEKHNLVSVNIEPGSFDVKSYLAAFDKLDLKDNVRDVRIYYSMNGWINGGRPYIYLSDKVYTWATPGGREFLKQHDLTHFFEVENSPEGYFQLIVYEIVGQRFALCWHANYGEEHIICTPERLKQVHESLEGRESWGVLKINDTLVFKRDYTPQISMDRGSCTVSVYTFSPFGGLYLNRYSVKRPSLRNDPGMKGIPMNPITLLKRENIYEYDCGVMF